MCAGLYATPTINETGLEGLYRYTEAFTSTLCTAARYSLSHFFLAQIVKYLPLTSFTPPASVFAEDIENWDISLESAPCS